MQWIQSDCNLYFLCPFSFRSPLNQTTAHISFLAVPHITTCPIHKSHKSHKLNVFSKRTHHLNDKHTSLKIVFFLNSTHQGDRKSIWDQNNKLFR